MDPYPTDPARYPALARVALFRDLSPSLLAGLSSAPRVANDLVAPRLKAIFPIEANGIGGASGTQPIG